MPDGVAWLLIAFRLRPAMGEIVVELNGRKEDLFLVIHPLDDQPEQKVDTAHLGPMPMTHSVRFSLMALRAYLVLMMLLVLYHVVDLAAFGRG